MKLPVLVGITLSEIEILSKNDLKDDSKCDNTTLQAFI